MRDLGTAILMLIRDVLFSTLVMEGMIVKKYLVAWRDLALLTVFVVPR